MRAGCSCRFIGYRFQSGNAIYVVNRDGSLRMLQDGKILLEEQGELVD